MGARRTSPATPQAHDGCAPYKPREGHRRTTGSVGLQGTRPLTIGTIQTA